MIGGCRGITFDPNDRRLVDLMTDTKLSIAVTIDRDSKSEHFSQRHIDIRPADELSLNDDLEARRQEGSDLEQGGEILARAVSFDVH